MPVHRTHSLGGFPDDFWSKINVITVTWDTLCDDGILLDYSQLAHDYPRLRYWPILVTRQLYDTWITPPKALAGWQDETGRAWDIFTHLQLLVGSQLPRLVAEGQATIHVYFQTSPHRRKIVPIAVHLAPGDTETAIVVSLPEED